MMAPPTPASAALNNALWCDAVCRAHGLPTAWDGALWRCLRPAPPFYPNAVTLEPNAPVAAIGALLDAGLGDTWAVKDSFAALDLAPLGFAPLFDATWIGRPAEAVRPAGSGLRWEVVGDDAGLAAWEAAEEAGEEPKPLRRFPPALLAEPGVVFLAGRRGEALVAGAILNITGEGSARVVGFSNAFAFAGEDVAACWREAAAQAALHAPGLPVVGYEPGGPLHWALEAGFAPLGPLRVWARARDF